MFLLSIILIVILSMTDLVPLLSNGGNNSPIFITIKILEFQQNQRTWILQAEFKSFRTLRINQTMHWWPWSLIDIISRRDISAFMSWILELDFCNCKDWYKKHWIHVLIFMFCNTCPGTHICEITHFCSRCKVTHEVTYMCNNSCLVTHTESAMCLSWCPVIMYSW